MSRYIIIGAGAVGATIGARLFESGHEVVLVARGAHLDQLRRNGLRFLTPSAARTLPVPTIANPGELTARPDDVLILATKTQHSEAALESWLGYGHAGTQPPLILAQNGVANEPLALRRFELVYAMCVWMPALHLEPGVVEARGVPYSGVLHLGRYPRGADEFIRDVAEDLEASGFLAPVTDDVMRWKYAKLLGNLVNALEALTGPVESEQAKHLLARARAEGAAVLAAAGIDYASEAEQAPIWKSLRSERPDGGADRAGNSSWQSLARGTGSIETDYLNGEIVLLGRLHDVPTPVNAALLRLSAVQAREHRPPASLTVTELAAEVDCA